MVKMVSEASAVRTAASVAGLWGETGARPSAGGAFARRWKRSAVPGLAVLVAGAFLSTVSPARAQERPPIFINEILAANGDVTPEDVCGGTPDMIEIYNASDEPFSLGRATPQDSFYLSDSDVFTTSATDPRRAWQFPANRSTVPARGSIIVFCDGRVDQGACELHATFQINNNGSEPITLWGPDADGDGERDVVDQVWLPPLRQNVSLGRFPDGAGPAPVPLEETLDTFVFNELGSDSEPTFGSCSRRTPSDPICENLFGPDRTRNCFGAPNGEGTNLEPSVDRAAHSTNSPLGDEPVEFVVRVEDDKDPTPPNIASVELVYRVDGGSPQHVAMAYDSVTGILDGSDRMPPRPLERWSLWTGTIPGQPAGSRVEFHFVVRDAEGLETTNPRPLCDDICPECSLGCDREFGGPNCLRDDTDVTCVSGDRCDDGDGTPPVLGERYIACDAWFTYAVGYEPRFPGLVVNEVVAAQDGLLADPTHRPCNVTDQCGADPDCCKKQEDFIELYNASNETIELAGLWLSDSFFNPNMWRFPEGSTIAPGEYLIIWCDNDGGQCPDPGRATIPCFWECPDPTDPSLGRYHTNFALDLQDDQFFIFDTEENGFGLIHGVTWPLESGDRPMPDQSIALLPDGDRDGCFVVIESPSPGGANSGECPEPLERFKRGDTNTDCGVDLTDAVLTLNFLFLGGVAIECQDAADADDNGQLQLTDAIWTLSFLFLGTEPPPPPGHQTPGPDPTDDDLPPCVYNEECF